MPAWHTVNDYDLDGNVCIAPTKEGVDCGVICVRSDSPQSCPPGYPAITAPATNPCLCQGDGEIPMPENPGFSYIPCENPVNQSIPDWQGDGTTHEFCVNLYSNGSNVGDIEFLSPSSTGPGPYALACDAPPVETLNWVGGPFIAIYAIFGGYFAATLVWALFKNMAEKKYKREDKERAVDFDDNDDNDSMDFDMDAPKVTQRGFSNHIVGTILFYYMVFLSLSWQAIMLFLVGDYYYAWGPVRYTKTPNDLAIAFIVAWHFMTLWYCVVLGVGDKVRNFYRLRAPLTECDYLEVWREFSAEVFEVSNSFIMNFFARWEAWKTKVFGTSGSFETLPVLLTENGTRYIQFECRPQSYNQKRGAFEPNVVLIGPTHAQILEQSRGLTSQEVHDRIESVGPNFISVYVANWFFAMCTEFADVYYIYQGVLLWVWFYFDYWQMGLVLLAVILLAGFMKVYIKRKSELKIKKMAEHKDECMVLRDGRWNRISTDRLVPGDVFEVEVDMIVPCDAAVIKGSCVNDESMLTGEAMPVQKFTVRNDTYEYKKQGSSKKMSMFAGTKVLQLQSDSEGGKVLAMVANTGANTDKGELVAKILFPVPITFIFDQHLKMVFILLIMWACCTFGVALYFMQAAGPSAWFYGIFMVSQILSPLLPAVLVVGQSVAADRLSKKGIFCLNLHRITVSGKVQLFCFDKTGTLTREGLEFYAVQPVKDVQFSEANENPDHLPMLLQQAMGTAHTISMLGDRFVGNPVDCEMFKSSGWKLEQSETGDILRKSGQEVKILKVFEFEHARMSMSVCFLDVTTGETHVIVKGSYEKIKQVSNPESVPADYDEVTSQHAVNGSYTLGIAHKSFGKNFDTSNLEKMQREDFENGCDCVGLIMFKNKLKDDAEKSIRALKEGAVRPVMITGDNALTGVYIARECGMTLEKDGIVILGDVAKTNNSGPTPVGKEKQGKSMDALRTNHTRPTLRWSIIGTDEEVKIEDYVDFSDYGSGNASDIDFESAQDDMAGTTDCMMKMTSNHGLNESGRAKSVELAVTGKAFDVLCQNGMMRPLLLNTRIFARMTPDGKVKCVELHMERGITAMCGDGGNDCGALRAAHAGLALSDAEASIVSPFSSNDRGVNSVVRLLREGRAALATSFASYKYLLWYGETIVFMKMMILYFGVSLSQYLWMLLDSFTVVVLSYAISQAKPTKKLSTMRPSARLLGIETVFGVTSIVFINVFFLIASMFLLFNQTWFVCREFDSSTADLSKWYLLGDNWEGETLGVLVMFQTLSAASLGNFGADFRGQWWKNWVFVIAFIACFLIFALMLFLDPNPYGCAFRFECGDPDVLVDLGYFSQESDVWWAVTPYNTPNGHNVFPMDFRWKLFGLAMGNFVIDHIWYWVVVLGPVRTYLRRKYPLERLKVTL